MSEIMQKEKQSVEKLPVNNIAAIVAIYAEVQRQNLQCIFIKKDNKILELQDIYQIQDGTFFLVASKENRREIEKIFFEYDFFSGKGGNKDNDFFYRKDFFYTKPALLVWVNYIEYQGSNFQKDGRIFCDSYLLQKNMECSADLQAVLCNNLRKNDVFFSGSKEQNIFRRFVRDTVFRYPDAGKNFFLIFWCLAKNAFRILCRRLFSQKLRCK